MKSRIIVIVNTIVIFGLIMGGCKNSEINTSNEENKESVVNEWVKSSERTYSYDVIRQITYFQLPENSSN